MKTLAQAYLFDPAARTIAFTDLSVPLAQEQVLVITNVANNVILYSFADPTFAGSTLVGNVLTLPAGVDTSAMSSTDRLQIWLDISDPADLTPAPVYDPYMRMADLIAQAVGRLGYASDGSLRVVATGGSTISTVSTAYMSFGDMGKPGTMLLVSHQAFHAGLGQNFVKS